MKVKLMLMAVIISVLTGCASQGLKSPCNEYASFCGDKTKINLW